MSDKRLSEVTPEDIEAARSAKARRGKFPGSHFDTDCICLAEAEK